MDSGTLWQAIYWSPTLALTALMVILAWRRLAREFPFFFSYIVVAWAKDLADFVAYHKSPGAYFYTYWISHLVSAVFILLATYELSLTRLFPRFYKVGFYRHLFSVAALIAIGVGVSAAYEGSGLKVVPQAIHVINILQVIALLFFVGLMQFMGRQWARYEFGIALGLGVNAVAFVIFFVIFLRSGPLHGMMRELPTVADALVCLIWLVTFLRPESPTAPPIAPVSPEVLDQARKWEKTLKESLTAKKPQP
jgi:hypothetical protein